MNCAKKAVKGRLSLASLSAFVLLALLFGVRGFADHGKDPPRSPTNPVPNFTESAAIKLKGARLLIVTHPSSHFDETRSAKKSTDDTIAFCKRNGVPVVYLHDNDWFDTYYYADSKPDYFAKSSAGEVGFNVPMNDVVLVGGTLDGCLKATAADLIDKWSKRTKQENIRITFVGAAVYVDVPDTAFGEAMERDFPGLHNRLEKLVKNLPQDRKTRTVEQIRTAFSSEEEFHRFLSKALVPTVLEASSHRWVLQVDGKNVKVLREGKDIKSPILTFNYVSSSEKLPKQLNVEH